MDIKGLKCEVKGQPRVLRNMIPSAEILVHMTPTLKLYMKSGTKMTFTIEWRNDHYFEAT